MALRHSVRPLKTGALPGAVVFVGLFVLCVTTHASAEYMGVENEEVSNAVITLFEGAIIGQQLGLLAFYILIGASLGLVAYCYLELYARWSGRPFKGWRRFWGSMLLVALIHSWFLARSSAVYPQLYAPQLEASAYLDLLFGLGAEVLPLSVIDAIGHMFCGIALGMLLVIGYRAYRDRRIHMRQVALGAAAASLSVAVIAAVVMWPPPEVERADRPNVVFIGVDSLRTDVMTDLRDITPNLDAFAQHSVHFSRGYTVMPRTFPAWASILTGQYPHTHGIRHMFPQPDDSGPLANSLATILRVNGYRTAVIGDFAADVFSRADFGFEHVDVAPFTLASNVEAGGLKLHVHLMPYVVDLFDGAGFNALKAHERLGDPAWLTADALDWVDDADGRPFFLTVFYSTGHFPFASPAPFYDRFTDPNYKGASRFHKESFGAPLEGAARKAERQHIKQLYLGAIAASDDAIGKLLRGLDQRGALDNTVVVVTADHGENLYEHGLGVGHGDHLYGLSSIEVPILFSWPHLRHPGRIIDAPARTIDIAPTVLSKLGINPLQKPDGVDLTRVIAGEAGPPNLPVFAETGLWFFPPETRRLDGRRIEFAEGFSAFRYKEDGWEIYLDPQFEETALMAKHRVLLDGERKLLYMPTRDGVKWELYDPVEDPAEQNELSEIEPERLEAMKTTLLQWMLQDEAMTLVGDMVLPARALGLADASEVTP